MNRKNAALFLPLVQALADGKTIQYRVNSGMWVDMDSAGETAFDRRVDHYRVKPEPVITEKWMVLFEDGFVSFATTEVGARMVADGTKHKAGRGPKYFLKVTTTDGVPSAAFIQYVSD
jgi:uncharacterized protein (DUF1684 family)